MLREPLSTYRIQLNGQFGFDDAAKIIPYLEELGIDHLYCSPLFQAAPGSTPSSGNSGSDTAEERSSISMMRSHARASSYPPPDAVPFTAARYVCPELAVASSINRFI